MKTRYPLMLVIVTLLGGALLAGCDGYDDLRLHNHYPFPVRARLRYPDAVTHKPVNQVLGIVPAHGVSTFKKAAQYKGAVLEYASYETKAGKTLGKLSATKGGMARTRTDHNGTGVWDVTVP